MEQTQQSPTRCGSCGLECRYPAHLRRHLARKTPCAPIVAPVAAAPDLDPEAEKRTCSFCGRVYSSYISMRRHVRTACKIAPTAHNGETGMQKLYLHAVQQMAAQTEQISRLVGVVERLTVQSKPAPTVELTGDNNNVAISNNQTQIVVNVFGLETTQHITQELIRSILVRSLSAGGVADAAQAAILETAMAIYSNTDYPENITCYIPNKKSDEAMVRASTGWEIKPLALVLPPMALKSIDAIFHLQPPESDFAPPLKEIAKHEASYADGHKLKTILIRNKALCAAAHGNAA